MIKKTYSVETPKCFTGGFDYRDIQALLSELYPPSEVATVSTTSVTAMCRDRQALVIARDRDGNIVSMARLAVIGSPIPTRQTGAIQDVVTCKHNRGKVYDDPKLGMISLAEKLLRVLIEQAQEMKLHRLELTINPRRIAANRLYQRLGFSLVAQPLEDGVGTNLYRLSLR